MSKRVRTLLRVSSRQQLHDNDIPIQRAEAEQYIKSRQDWVFDREYMEKAVSAYKNHVEDRDVLMEIMEDAKRGNFDVLLTYMSDRIGRKEEYSAYVATLNSLGVEVWTIKDGQLKTEEHIDKLLNFIRFWQNEGESKKTGMRVKDTQKEMVRAGKFVGGRAPFGYRLIPSGNISNHGRMLKKLEIVEEEARVVRKIYSLAVYQGMGYERIAKALNKEEIPAIHTDKWKAGTIAGILKNPVYMGYFAIDRRAGSGEGKRQKQENWTFSEKQNPELVIVPKKDWERAKELREARSVQPSIATKGRLALTGLLYCGYCGQKLKNGSYCNHWTVKKTGEKKEAFVGRYVCPQKCKARTCYAQKYLEKTVFEVVEEILGNLQGIDVMKELQQMEQKKQEAAEKKWHKAKTEQKLLQEDIRTLEEKLPEAIRGEYCFSEEKLSSVIREKEKRLEKLKKQLEEMKHREANADQYENGSKKKEQEALDWKLEFHNADIGRKKMLLWTMIERIDVMDETICIRLKVCLQNYLNKADVLLLPKSVGFGVPEQGL